MYPNPPLHLQLTQHYIPTMDSWIPREIFIPTPCFDNDDATTTSRWSEDVPEKSLCLPRRPSREILKTDCMPKIPQRANGPDQRLRAPVRRRSMPFSLPRAHQEAALSQDYRPRSLSQVQRSSRIRASLIAARVHRETSRPEPDANSVLARAA